jgi:hypothetical protein
LDHEIQNNNNGIRWKFTTKLEDLDFADDIALLSSTFRQIEEKTHKLNEIAKQTGLKINGGKDQAIETIQ